MTYHWNMFDLEALLAEEDVLDQALEDLVGAPQVGTDDSASDEDDDCGLDDLLLPRPLDLLQLRPRLRDESLRAAPRDCRPATGLGLRRLRGRAHLCLTRARACGQLALGRLLAASAALLPGLARQLPRLPVSCVAAAPATVLRQLEPVRRVSPGVVGL